MNVPWSDAIGETMRERPGGASPTGASASEAVLRKAAHVPFPAEEAFHLYTDGIATWWPLRTHSVAKEDAATCVFEARVGGRIYERTSGGEELLWGTVVECEPPSRIVYAWHPGRSESTSQQVEMRFDPDGEGTRVEIVHTGWDRYGDDRDEAFADYETGWEYVLRKLAEHAAANR